MEHLERLKNMLREALDEIVEKGELSAGDLEAVHKLTDTIKNVDKIECLEEDGGYSENSYRRYANGNYSRDNSYGNYNRGNSYARRGMHYVRGHYSRDGGYSMDEGREDMAAGIEELMQNMSGNDRQIMQKALEILRK